MEPVALSFSVSGLFFSVLTLLPERHLILFSTEPAAKSYGDPHEKDDDPHRPTDSNSDPLVLKPANGDGIFAFCFGATRSGTSSDRITNVPVVPAP